MLGVAISGLTNPSEVETPSAEAHSAIVYRLPMMHHFYKIKEDGSNKPLGRGFHDTPPDILSYRHRGRNPGTSLDREVWLNRQAE